MTLHFQLKQPPEFDALLEQEEAGEGQLGPLTLPDAAVGPEEQL